MLESRLIKIMESRPNMNILAIKTSMSKHCIDVWYEDSKDDMWCCEILASQSLLLTPGNQETCLQDKKLNGRILLKGICKNTPIQQVSAFPLKDKWSSWPCLTSNQHIVIQISQEVFRSDALRRFVCLFPERFWKTLSKRHCQLELHGKAKVCSGSLRCMHRVRAMIDAIALSVMWQLSLWNGDSIGRGLRSATRCITV